MGKAFKSLTALLISIGLTLLPTLQIRASSTKNSCPFCNQAILNYQKFYEDTLVLALYIHKPILPGHSLIIPKRHVERFEDLTEEESAQIISTIKKVNGAAEKAFGTSTYLLLQKNGKEVGQTVPHIHVHYIPRKSGDDSIFKFLIKMLWVGTKWQKPISSSAMEEMTSKMKEHI